MTILTIIFLIAIVLVIAFGFNYLLTLGILWVSNGLFNYNLDDKFWYVFVLILILSAIFNSKTVVNKK